MPKGHKGFATGNKHRKTFEKKLQARKEQRTERGKAGQKQLKNNIILDPIMHDCGPDPIDNFKSRFRNRFASKHRWCSRSPALVGLFSLTPWEWRDKELWDYMQKNPNVLGDNTILPNKSYSKRVDQIIKASPILEYKQINNKDSNKKTQTQ